MPPEDLHDFQKAKYVRRWIMVLVVLVLTIFFLELRPANRSATALVMFEVKSGEGFTEIANDLATQGLIRSKFAFELISIATGASSNLRPGIYEMSQNMWSPQVIYALMAGSRDMSVTIPEGWNVFQIDNALSDALVIPKGELIDAASSSEGTLFPDTYQFANNEPIGDILQTFSKNFDAKTGPLFMGIQSSTEEKTLIIASMLEKEAPDPTDQSIIAGIIEKRATAGIALGIDATVCYAKQLLNSTTLIDCASLTAGDFKIDSPYNTYIHYGLPPGPIGNPGVVSITAALHPTPTPYWYYLSDPTTGKIIYAKTLEEQNQNIAKYLR